MTFFQANIALSTLLGFNLLVAIHTYIHTYNIHIYIHTYIHTHIHTHTYTYLHTYIIQLLDKTEQNIVIYQWRADQLFVYNLYKYITIYIIYEVFSKCSCSIKYLHQFFAAD